MLISACPYCLTMFTDGIQETSPDSKMKSLDIAEVLYSVIL